MIKVFLTNQTYKLVFCDHYFLVFIVYSASCFTNRHLIYT